MARKRGPTKAQRSAWAKKAAATRERNRLAAERKRAEQNARRRERYAEKKAAAVKPKASKPKAKASRPKATTQPKASRPKASKPKASKPKASKPKATKATAPKATKPRASNARPRGPDGRFISFEREAIQAEATREPDFTKWKRLNTVGPLFERAKRHPNVRRELLRALDDADRIRDTDEDGNPLPLSREERIQVEMRRAIDEGRDEFEVAEELRDEFGFDDTSEVYETFFSPQAA